jgi:RIO kinase 1
MPKNSDLDAIEARLMKEDSIFYGMSGGNSSIQANADFGKKVNLSARIQNDITRGEKKANQKNNNQDRGDRATSEQVLDPRTRLILFKLLNSGYLSEIDGCLSTGKEANVYYARGKEGQEFAVKIFKTSILVFKDRDIYVSGEYRFRNGYCKSNPRKMVKTWAEKEMRNLKRLSTAGIPCPTPHLLKSHVLVMDFLGKDGWCAERLKEVTLTTEQTIDSYLTICVDVRRMYHECNLVHGDLSEYNLLWHENRAKIIDVSQSVEHSHPYANDFLRKDISNITDFFRKKGMYVLSNYDLFNFVTKLVLQSKTVTSSTPKNNNSNSEIESYDSDVFFMRNCLQEMLLESERKADELDDEEEARKAEANNSDDYENDHFNNEKEDKAMIEDSIFLQSYIPTSLNEIANPQAEMLRMQKGGREKGYIAAVNRMLGGNDKDNNEEAEKGEEDESDLDEDDSSSDSDESITGDQIEEHCHRKDLKWADRAYQRTLPDRDTDPEARASAKEQRKEARKAAKEAAAEKRKQKIPKHVKKRATKQNKGK